MAKALKTIGVVVAVVGIAASAAFTFGGSLGLAAGIVGAAGAVATGAAVAGTVISLISGFVKSPGFSNGGNPLNFVTNPQSGLPYGMGRTRMSGIRIHADTTDAVADKVQNDVVAFAVLLCAGGMIQGIESFKADNLPLSSYSNYMAETTSLGGNSALSLTLGAATMPGWTPQHKLSGISHSLWMMKYDSKGEYFQNGVPDPSWVGLWNKVYDPRKDSTYPGGAGPQRALNELTYEWSRNPALHALTWAIGRWQNNRLTIGIGAPLLTVRLSDFVEAANIADANNWNCGGFAWTTDSKWSVLKSILQACGSTPTMNGAMIGCVTSAPRVSLTTIKESQLLNGSSISVVKSRRDRFNAVIPRFTSESHDWDVISGSLVSNPLYEGQDGRRISKEIDFVFVQSEVGQIDVNGELQVGQLSAYEIANSRESGIITFAAGPEYIGLKSGDCITLDNPSDGLPNQLLILQSSTLEVLTGKMLFTAVTETPSKHPFALGKTTILPKAFELMPLPQIPAIPSQLIWSILSTLSQDGIPSITITGVNEYTTGADVLIRHKRSNEISWSGPNIFADPRGDFKHEIKSLEGLAEYNVEISYRNSHGQGEWLAFQPKVTLSNNLSQNIIDVNSGLGSLQDPLVITVVEKATMIPTEQARTDLVVGLITQGSSIGSTVPAIAAQVAVVQATRAVWQAERNAVIGWDVTGSAASPLPSTRAAWNAKSIALDKAINDLQRMITVNANTKIDDLQATYGTSVAAIAARDAAIAARDVAIVKAAQTGADAIQTQADAIAVSSDKAAALAQASIATAKAAAADASQASAATQAGLSAIYRNQSGNSLAEIFPKVISQQGFTIDRHTFGTANASILPDNNMDANKTLIRQTVGIGTYSFGVWFRALVALQPNKTYKISSRMKQINSSGTDGGYVLSALVVFNASGIVLGEYYPTGYTTVSSSALAAFDYETTTAQVLALYPSASHVRFGILTNRHPLTVLLGAGQIDITSMSLEDVTESKKAETAAAIAQSEASVATANAAIATSEKNLTVQYRGEAQTAASTAGQAAANTAGSAAATAANANDVDAAKTVVLANAAIVDSKTAIAIDAASKAQVSQSITANISSGLRPNNASFTNWPVNAALPELWVYSYGGGNTVTTRVTGDNGGGAIKINMLANQATDWEIAQNTPHGSISTGYYVLHLDADFLSGSWAGAAVQFTTYSAQDNVLSTDLIYMSGADASGSVLGNSPAGGRYYFRKLIFVPANASRYFIGLSGPGFWSPNTTGAAIIYRQCGFRAATPSEIRDQTVLLPLQSAVSTQATEIAVQASINAAQTTSLNQLNASVNGNTALIVTQGTVLADHTQRLAVHAVRVQAGTGEASVELSALDINGAAATAIKIIADTVAIKNKLNGQVINVATFAGGVARIENALLRTAKVSNSSTSQIYHDIELRPLSFLASDGEVVQYQGGDSYFAMPRIEFDASGLPSLAAGSSYEISANAITPKQFTAKVKVIAGGTYGNQSTGAGSNVGGTPQWQVDKPTATDANNNLYQFSFSGISAEPDNVNFFNTEWDAQYIAQVDVYYAASSGSWVNIATMNIAFSRGGTANTYGQAQGQANSAANRSYTYTDTVTIGSAIGQHGGKEFGVHPLSGTITDFTNVVYTTQSAGSASPVPAKIPWKVYPPNS